VSLTETERDVLDTLQRLGVEASAASITELLLLVSRSEVRRRAAEVAQLAARPTVPSQRSHDPIVYFVRNGNMVKIGTTTNLRRRMSKLSQRMDNVVKKVPGGRDVEAQYHRRFTSLRDGKTEWFRLEGALAELLGEEDTASPSDKLRRVLEEAGESPEGWEPSADDQADNTRAVVFGLVKEMTPQGGLMVGEIVKTLVAVYGEQVAPRRQTVTRWLREDDRVFQPTYGKYAVRDEDM
jgi:hypothetical protein